MAVAAAGLALPGLIATVSATLVNPKMAQAIAAEVGAQTAVLDPIEGLDPGSTQDYLSLMRANLATLRLALDCG